jgi:hypothetical protein
LCGGPPGCLRAVENGPRINYWHQLHGVRKNRRDAYRRPMAQQWQRRANWHVAVSERGGHGRLYARWPGHLQDCLTCWGTSRVRKSKRFATSFRPLAPKLSRAAGSAIFSGKIDRGIGRVNMVGGRAEGPVAAPDNQRAATLDNEITQWSH